MEMGVRKQRTSSKRAGRTTSKKGKSVHGGRRVRTGKRTDGQLHSAHKNKENKARQQLMQNLIRVLLR
jgi:hypothetical protein